MGVFTSDQQIVLTTVGVDLGARALLDKTIERSATLKSELSDIRLAMRKGGEAAGYAAEGMKYNAIEMEKNKQMYRALADSAKLPTKEVTDLHFGLDGIRKTTMKYAEINGEMIPIQKKVTTGLKAFRMELLSVMFFGYAVQKVLGGITQSGFEMIGATELWANAMTITMLPAMLAIMPTLDNMLISIMNLDENTRLFAGIAILAGQGIGTFLGAFGAIGLGLMGLAQLDAAIAAISTGIGIMVSVASGIAIPLLAIAVIFTAWQTNFLGFRDYWQGFASNITKVIEWLKGVGTAIDDIITKIPFIGDAWTALKNTMKPVSDWIGGLVDGIEKVLNYIAGKGFKTNAELNKEAIYNTPTTQGTFALPNKYNNVYAQAAQGLNTDSMIYPQSTMHGEIQGQSTAAIYLNPTYNINVNNPGEMQAYVKEQIDYQTQQIKTAIK